MKLTKLIGLAGILLAGTTFGATLNFFNITVTSGSDIMLFDNSGAPLADGILSLHAGTAPTTALDASLLGAPIDQVTMVVGGNAPTAGFVSSAFGTDNRSGALTGLDLFIVVTNAAGDEFGVIDIASTFAVTDTDTAPYSTTEGLLNPALITLEGPGSGAGNLDYSPVGPPSAPGYIMTLAKIPEPSVSLLAGLAGLGLMIRRKR